MSEQNKPVRRLVCSCCGAHTKGRQWHNRDEGYGLCSGCVDWLESREDAETMRRCYGDRGVHYDLKEGAPPAGAGHPPGHPMQGRVDLG